MFFEGNITMIDLDRLHPDWKFAQDHGVACQPGIPIFLPNYFNQPGMDDISSNEVCPCCLNIIHKDPVPFCSNSKQLQFLGFGFPLYFIFVKYLIVILLIHLLSYGALGIVWALQSTYGICVVGGTKQLPDGHEGVCSSWLIRFMRTEEYVTTEQMVLRFSTFALQLACLVYLRDVMRKTMAYYNERNTCLSHYSVLFSRIPPQEGIEGKLRHLLEKEMGDPPLHPQEIVPINDLQLFHNYEEEKREAIGEKKKWLDHQEDPQFQEKLESLNKEINLKEEKVHQQYVKQTTLIETDKVICDKVIVVLNSEDAKDLALERFYELDPNVLQGCLGAGGENISIEGAPQPKQIMWENFNIPTQKRWMRILGGWIFSLVFIAAITGVFFLLIRQKTDLVEKMLHEQHQDSEANKAHPEDTLESQALAVTMLTLFGVILFNKFILAWVLHLFTDFEKHRTSTQYEFSFMFKFTLGLFFTTALLTLLVQDLIYHNIYSEKYGVAEEESIMFFLDAFFIPLIWIVHPWFLFRLIQRWYYYGKQNITQREANFYMQNPHFSLGKKYSEIIQSIWMAYFYSSLIPGGILIMFFGVICYYWVDKFVLLRRSIIEENVSGELSMLTIKLIDFTLVLRPLGEIIFDSQIRMSGVEWVSIVCISIGTVYMILPMNSILEQIHGEEFRSEQKRYLDIKSHFIQNYRTMNPLFVKERINTIRNLKMSNKVLEFILNKQKRQNCQKRDGSDRPQSSRKLNMSGVQSSKNLN